jgi:succinyl-CoA synthetase beta subunit
VKKQIADIIEGSRSRGWVLEPEAKKLLTAAGIDVPRFAWVKTPDEAIKAAKRIGYPIVAKIVSPRAIHKTELGGVVAGVCDDKDLRAAFARLEEIDGFEGVLIDEMLSGVELIVGSKTDEQFGPVVLLGIGGVGVELYKDTVIRMAPLEEHDVLWMLHSLKAHALLEGFRGAEPVSVELLTKLLMKFSALTMDLAGAVESIDLNPVICSATRCAAADARIVL